MTNALVQPRPPRVAILGVGNELSGDDAAGVLTVRELARAIGPRQDTLLIDAGTAPENFGGPLRRFRPDLVLLVDAADFEGQPGACVFLDCETLDGVSAFPHALPPSVFARFLIAELSCRVTLAAIQPAQTGFGQPLSAAVRNGLDRLVPRLADWLQCALPARTDVAEPASAAEWQVASIARSAGRTTQSATQPRASRTPCFRPPALPARHPRG